MKKARNILTAILTVSLFFSVQAANDKDGEKELSANTKIATTAIQGKVVDKNTGEALTGAKIVFEELGVTTYTDFDGVFSISGVKPGDYEIKTSLISYSDKNASVKINLTESEEIEIQLESVNK